MGQNLTQFSLFWAILGWGNCLSLTLNELSDSWQVCIVIATTCSKLQVVMYARMKLFIYQSKQMIDHAQFYSGHRY